MLFISFGNILGTTCQNDGMNFIVIVFTILKDMDNETVMQNHYVCYNYFDKYL